MDGMRTVREPQGPPAPASARADADPAALVSDDAAWDDFVASTRLAPYLQATPWARVKARNGWSSRRVVAGRVGAQLLTHRIGPLPWSVGYAPRAPVARILDEPAVREWTEAMRRAAREARLSHVVIDPEIEAGGPELDWFRGAGWRLCPSPQPARSRWIDLARNEDELWDGLRGKWRQYVQKARRAGVRVMDAGPERLGDFYAIYVETARRAGFTYRTEATYRAVYEAYASRDRARLLFAVDAEGRAQATLMLLGWGGRIVEPYGGMTRPGAESRANYLLKWEAIRSSRDAGYALYDLWGLSHAGIEHFKAGFGGREVNFIGGLEMRARPVVRTAVQVLQAARVLLATRRLEGERRATADGAEP
jgi:lipid II:glycine glycyltransferase (peptidoglycan interpeptide bridge formation enzyme)